MKLVTAQEMQAIDRRTIDAGLVPALVLMERAGAAAAGEALGLLSPARGARVEILCGKGNNGGDGLVVARLLATRGVQVGVHLTDPPSALSPDARTNLRRLRRTRATIDVLPDRIASASSPFARRLGKADLCVDALLGTGADRPLPSRLAGLVDLLNQVSKRTLALDIPSGVDASTGGILGTSVSAHTTVTFGLPKLGLALYPGRERVGRLVVADIGFPAEVVARALGMWNWVDAARARRLLPRLEPTAHKYDRGELILVAGSRRYPGAAALAAEAALRSGAGMVHLVVPASIRDLMEGMLREVIVHACGDNDEGNCDASILDVIQGLAPRRGALAIGSGMRIGAESRPWVQRLLAETRLPAVVDSQAILSLPEASHPGPRIATPHARELARWLQEGSLADADRVAAAERAARSHDVIVVAKGGPTIVVAPDGTKHVNGSGNSGLATAGTGDVLTGIVGGLLAQGLASLDAAMLAVFLHGLAADCATKDSSPRSLIAGDLLSNIGAAYRTIESSPE